MPTNTGPKICGETLCVGQLDVIAVNLVLPKYTPTNQKLFSYYITRSQQCGESARAAQVLNKVISHTEREERGERERRDRVRGERVSKRETK